MYHLECHNLLIDNQHGFRKHRSCETQLVNTIEDILRAMDNRKQVDILILDFSKAFDTVPHQRLLNKLDFYGIRGEMKNWIATKRTQRVILDGEASNDVEVKSGVPQGTVLGPLMFLLYINDMGKGINYNLKLFADDSLLYRVIDKPSDTTLLQNDLSILSNWANAWQMQFNAEKCYVIRAHRNQKSHLFYYKMKGHSLKDVDHQPYLGVELSNTMNWSHHIGNVIKKANRSLGFIRRNLGSCPAKVKEQAYMSLVRPHLEYSSSAWDPHLSKHQGWR